MSTLIQLDPTGRFPIRLSTTDGMSWPNPLIAFQSSWGRHKVASAPGGLDFMRLASKEGRKKVSLQQVSGCRKRQYLSKLIKYHALDIRLGKLDSYGQLFFVTPAAGKLQAMTMALWLSQGNQKRPLRHSSGGHHDNEGRDFSELICWTDYLESVAW